MATDIEKIMGQILDNLGYRYYEQYELYPYIVDFYFPEFKIVVEADGDIWHSYKTDKDRDIDLIKRYGVRILHFSDGVIKKCSDNIVKVIQEEIEVTIYRKE